MYPYERGGVDVLYTSVFNTILDKKQWDIVALVRTPRKPKCSAFRDPLPTVTLPSLRSPPFGKLFEFVYLSFVDQIYYDKRVSSLTDTYLQRFDAVITPDPLLTVELCKRKNRPRVIQFVSGAWADTIARSQPFLRSFVERIEHEAYRVADRVVFMDNAYASRFHFNRVRQVIIPNGVDLDLFTPSNFDRGRLRRDFGMEGKSVIITVGTLRKGVKGHEFLLQAIPYVLEAHPNAHFYLVGKGNQEFLRSLSESLRIEDNLHILGERMDIPSLLCASDIFVLPSLTEGTPGALLEAMAMELPCIATRVGNIPDVIRNLQEGILIEPSNPKEISMAISDILSKPDDARSLGIRARNRIEKHYNLTETVEAYTKLIEELCD